MFHATRAAFVAAACLLAAGCGGDGLVRTQGRLMKGGQPYSPQEGEVIQVLFAPIRADGKPATDFYVADVDQKAATFRPAGKNGKGMPPGKYRVAVEILVKRKDTLGGKLDAEKSPYVFDVDANTKEIVVDLDAPPKG